MAKKAESQNKIADFVAKYSNKGTGAGYKNSIEGFLRCMYGLPKKNTDGTRAAYDYEDLFNQYVSDKTRDKIADINAYSVCLVRDCVSKQSARQQLTYTVKFLRSYGITIEKDDIQDIKREAKGGAATIDKVMDHRVICSALKGSDVRSRALILMLASSGMRIGECLSLKLSDVDLNMSPVMINCRYTKNGSARYTFISQEATEALMEYLKVRDTYTNRAEKYVKQLQEAGKKATVNTDSDLLFPITDASVNKLWETMLKKAGLFTRDEKSGRNQYRIHSLRKFFISQLSLAGARTLAEHLAGHAGYLDASYRQVSPEFAAREYQKLQSVLTVCIPESTKQAIKVLDEKNVILSEKVEMHEMGYEGLKIQNQQLAGQISAIQKALSDVCEVVARLQAEKQGRIGTIRTIKAEEINE